MELVNLNHIKCDVRDCWPKEEQDFTPWLSKHLGELNDLTHTLLKFEEREKRIGRYEADIIATDERTDSKVVIENQFGSSNHDHLGKCLTYMSNIDANIVIWISERFNAEHLTAIKKLNENTNIDKRFYAIRVDCYKVGELHLYDFVVEEQPDELPQDSLNDNKYYLAWKKVEPLLTNQDLKGRFNPWARNYFDFRGVVEGLPKVVLSMSFNRNGSHVYLFTYDEDSIATVDAKLKGCPVQLTKNAGKKNKDLTLWSIDKEGNPDPEWTAKALEAIYNFLNKK